ncbi:MAG: ATP-binding protein [Vicinamibacterales bacterium]
MSGRPTAGWNDANQRYLMAAVGVVRESLERHVARVEGRSGEHGQPGPLSDSAATQELKDAAADMPSPSALDVVCEVFALTPFARDLLVLCAGVELDSGFASLCAAAQGDAARACPTFSLALAALSAPHWSALVPAAPLRRWRLVEVTRGPLLTQSALRIDERVLHYLAGVQYADERLAGLIEFVPDSDDLVPSHQALVRQIVAAWSQGAQGRQSPIVELCGADAADARAVAASACAAGGAHLAVVRASALPAAATDLDDFARLWGREAALSNCALLVEYRDYDASDASRTNGVSQLVDALNTPVLLSASDRLLLDRRSVLRFAVQKPTAREQHALWQTALKDTPFTPNGEVDAMVAQFNLNRQHVLAARTEALASLARDGGAGTRDGREALWDACRTQARPRLESLAQRIEPAATWSDLVLPELAVQAVRDIAAQVRRRATVYDNWGFAAKGTRGLGISALFSGGSGTGKTMAAEVLAHELRLDLYRIDLSAVVSKYIGETEKNLRRVFDAADEGGAVLLFDEADALFGKRSEVKDSHDRYANIEVSYLLQRMEAYRGLAILTTNLKSAVDTAFLRRIRFIVQFPFPDAAQRAEIWRRVFPADTPTERLDHDKLARLNVTGGSIRNIAMNAAFFAADAGEPVRMRHLLRAAQSEYTKLEKSLTDAEIGGWVALESR